MKSKKSNRLMSLLLTACMILALIPMTGVTAFATEPETSRFSYDLYFGDECRYIFVA